MNMLTGTYRPTVYIAGPMTGYDNFNFDAFDRIAAKWDGRGFAVLNPADSFLKRQDLQYPQYMRSAAMLLLQASAIALIAGWQKSSGACMEALVAARLGLQFYNAETGEKMPTPALAVGESRGPKLPETLSPIHYTILRELVNNSCSSGCEACGYICDKLETQLNQPHTTMSFRLWELQKLGLVKKGRGQDETRRGVQARKYVITGKGRRALEDAA
jgi:hypothetical protein